jgi:hypothetical protein
VRFEGSWFRKRLPTCKYLLVRLARGCQGVQAAGDFDHRPKESVKLVINLPYLAEMVMCYSVECRFLKGKIVEDKRGGRLDLIF